MVFKCLHGLAPSCLSDLSVRRCSYNTRPAEKKLLVVPLTHKNTFPEDGKGQKERISKENEKQTMDFKY